MTIIRFAGRRRARIRPTSADPDETMFGAGVGFSSAAPNNIHFKSKGWFET